MSNFARDSVGVLSAVIIIAQSDIKYFIKVNLEQLFYETGHGYMIETLFTFLSRYYLS